MESTTSKATVLAKLIGFYTIEIRNLESGTVQSKADLLIMENLFYGRTINKTFDLKGIQGRKVKAGANSANPTQNSKTLFDGEWIEGPSYHPGKKVRQLNVFFLRSTTNSHARSTSLQKCSS